MKFRVERDILEEAVSATARMLPARPAIPVLAGIQIKAKGGIVSLFAFDYEISIRNQFPAEIEVEGEVLVSGRMLANISKQLPKKMIDLELQDGKVHITCGSIKFDVLTMTLDEYPAPPEFPAEIGTVDGGLLQEAVSQVFMSASRDDTLPLLATIRLILQGTKLTLVATDRYRLAVRELEWQPADPNIDTAALVKARKLSDAVKNLSGGQQVKLSLNPDEGAAAVLGLETAGQKMTTQLTEGEYPPVLGLFPTEEPIVTIVKREDLSQALRRVGVVAEQYAQVQLNFEAEVLTFQAGSGEDSQASEQIPCQMQGAESFSISFNNHYLRDGITALHGEYVRLVFTDSGKPAIMTNCNHETGESDPSFRYLIMPIRPLG